MLLLFSLISIFDIQSVSFASANKNVDLIAPSLPPYGSWFYKYRDQCGIANLCKNYWDIGCWDADKRKMRKANFQGEDYVKEGSSIPQFAYPWMVVILMHKSTGRGLCTATLISVRHVLTARHCFKGLADITAATYDVRVKVPAGKVFALLGPDRVGTMLFNFTYKAKQEVMEIKIPPNTYSDHDLALLRMRDVGLSDYIRPICLPFDGIPITGHYSFAGWGADEGRQPFGTADETFPTHLQEMKGLHVDTLHQEWPIHVENFHQLNPPTKWAHNGTNVTAFFYLNVTDNGTPCSGDSGGAITWQDPQTDRFYIMGILSRLFNGFSESRGGSVCDVYNTQKWRCPLFTKVSYYLDYIYREMNPDGFANGMCRSAECKDHNTTFVGKDELLSEPCGVIDDIGCFCLTGDAADVLKNRHANHQTKKDFLDNGYAECVECTDNKPDWNYQQWINEITLGSFNQKRYYGSESPYSAFAQSYFQGVFVDDHDNNLNNNATDFYGDVTCPHLHEKVVIPVNMMCDGVRDCPNAWDENPHICIGKCDHNVQHEEIKKYWNNYFYLRTKNMDMKTCFDSCRKSASCKAYEWTAFDGDCRIYNTSIDSMTDKPYKHTIFRGPRGCPELKQPGICRIAVIHHNRNGAFRIQDYRGYFARVLPDYSQKVNIHALDYELLIQNGSLPGESPEYQGNTDEWIFKYHGHESLTESYVTIMSGIVQSKGPFAVPMYLTVQYKFNGDNDEADVFMNPKLENFHDDANKLDQRFYLKHLYDITRNRDDLMFTAIYTKYYDANKAANITVRLFSDFADFVKGNRKAPSSQRIKGKETLYKLYASGPKLHPPTAKEGKFRFQECNEMLPHLKRVYENPPQRVDKAYDLCVYFKNDYTDDELHFGFGISMSHLRDMTDEKKLHLVENICVAIAVSDHIWHYAGKMMISAAGFRRMYETVKNVQSHDDQHYAHLLVKLKPFFLQNTP